MLTRIGVLVTLVVALSLLWSGTSEASHPFQQDGITNFLYPNLEAPVGSGAISYSLCGDAQNQAPSEWGTGVENWDNAISRWEFAEAAACNTAVHTQLLWEPTENYCVDPPPPFESSGCWEQRVSDPHGSHRDMRIGQPRLLFDRSAYLQGFSPTWQIMISAHEWGHNMSLADHDSANLCPTGGINSVMGKAIPNPQGLACIQGPSTSDLTSVECSVYTLCAGVRVAVGNVLGTSCPEVITAPGPGPDSWVRVWGAASGCMGSGAPVVLLAQFRAYVSGFQGGVYLAAGNVDTSTALDEVIMGAGPGGTPHVKLWRVNVGTSTSIEISGYLAYESGFSGGVRVGAGNLNCTGGAEILTVPGSRRPTEVRTEVFGQGNIGNFQPYPGWVGGAFVAGGNLSNTYCFDELGTGADAGGGPHAKTFCCASGSATLGSWMAYGGFGGGVRVGIGNHDIDTELEFTTGPGPGGNPQVRIWNKDGTEVFCCGFYAYDFGMTGGVFVAGGNVDLTGRWEIVTGADAWGGPHVKVFRCCTEPTTPPVSEVIGWMAW